MRKHNFLPCIFGSRQKTILHKLGLGDDEVRIQHYSNPGVCYDDRRTGKTGSLENANQIKNSACTVADFFKVEVPYSINLNVENFICPCHSNSVSATISGGTAGTSYTYQWYRSIDGINWTPISGSNSSYVNIEGTCEDNNIIFVKVEATDEDDNSVSATNHFVVLSDWPDQEVPCSIQIQNPSTNNSFTINPNPT